MPKPLRTTVFDAGRIERSFDAELLKETRTGDVLVVAGVDLRQSEFVYQVRREGVGFAPHHLPRI
jgi:hypothetical protein